MRKAEIEHWARSVIDQVMRAQPNEDSHVEIKRCWPPHDSAARQIAGHANAARGDAVLWLIGIDQKRRKVVGAGDVELAMWHAQVVAQFEDEAPAMINTNLCVGDKTVVALLFGTERAPYVARNPAHSKSSEGPFALEVPWREGTSVRSARHGDLIRLLVPLVRLPALELLQGKLKLAVQKSGCPPTKVQLVPQLSLQVYLMLTDGKRAVIPARRCEVEVTIPGHLPTAQLSGIRLTDDAGHRNIHCTRTELEATGTGPFELAAAAWIDVPQAPSIPEATNAHFTARFWVLEADRCALLSGQVPVEVVVARKQGT